jgi:hypothetical protein
MRALMKVSDKWMHEREARTERRLVRIEARQQYHFRSDPQMGDDNDCYSTDGGSWDDGAGREIDSDDANYHTKVGRSRSKPVKLRVEIA